MGKVTPLDPQTFLDEGYLHEVNRLVLHPLGLALQVIASADGGGNFSALIWDERDDPEGLYFGDDLLSAEKAENVARLMLERREARKEQLGYVIQPAGEDLKALTTTYLDPAARIGAAGIEAPEDDGPADFAK